MTGDRFNRTIGREPASIRESLESSIMQTTDATRYWKWWSRGRVLGSALIAILAMGLVTFGFHPRSYIEQHPGMTGLYRGFVVLSGLLFIVIIPSWMGMLRSRRAVSISEQWRSLASMFNLFILSQLNFVDRSLNHIMMIFFIVFVLPVAVYYFIKILEDQTRSDIAERVHPFYTEGSIRCD